MNAYRAKVGKPQGKRSLGNLDVGEIIILKWTSKNRMGGMDCTDLTQDRDQ
jgi:hypothetical protein